MNRANILLIDEFRMLDKNTIDLVLKRFLGAPRQPHYLTLKEYKNRPDLLEYNTEIYLSSAWFKSHWSYQKAKSYMANYLTGRRGYYICWLPYQLAILSGLKKREEIEDEMSEIDFDQASFDMEMGCLPVGDTDGSFFKFDDIDKSRKLKTAMYLNNAIVKQTKIPDLAENERRILSVDVALMASKTHKNDAACIILNSAIPKSNDTYSANIVFLENFEGLKTEELALTVRRMFDKFKCTDLVLDTAGQGLGIYDAISSDMVDYETGEVYPALSCCNDTAMAERCKVDNAPKVIWSVKATATFNSQAAITLRSGFQNNRINLLVSEFEADDILGDKIKGYSKMATVDQAYYKMSYVQTTLLVYELIALECEVNGTNVKVIEKSGKRKDRYSSLAYNYWIQCQLERETLKKREMGFDITGFTKCLKNLTHKPTFY